MMVDLDKFKDKYFNNNQEQKQEEEQEKTTIKTPDKNECPYCHTKFENETRKGIHITDKHIQKDQKIPRKENNNHKKTNVVKDKWQKQ